MRTWNVVAALIAFRAAQAGAQVAAPSGESPGKHETVLPEVRIDAIVGRRTGAQLGAGIVLDAGFYARIALLAAGGVERASSGALVGTQRVEAVLRFHTDPLRKSNPGVYFGGGLGARRSADTRTRATVIALIGFEAPYGHHLAPAFELGVGGGARIGIALRRARIDER